MVLIHPCGGSNPSSPIKARTAVLLFLKLNKRLCLVPRGAVVQHDITLLILHGFESRRGIVKKILCNVKIFIGSVLPSGQGTHNCALCGEYFIGSNPILPIIWSCRIIDENRQGYYGLAHRSWRCRFKSYHDRLGQQNPL